MIECWILRTIWKQCFIYITVWFFVSVYSVRSWNSFKQMLAVSDDFEIFHNGFLVESYLSSYMQRTWLAARILIKVLRLCSDTICFLQHTFRIFILGTTLFCITLFVWFLAEWHCNYQKYINNSGFNLSEILRKMIKL